MVHVWLDEEGIDKEFKFNMLSFPLLFCLRDCTIYFLSVMVLTRNHWNFINIDKNSRLTVVFVFSIYYQQYSDYMVTASLKISYIAIHLTAIHPLGFSFKFECALKKRVLIQKAVYRRNVTSPTRSAGILSF